MFHKRERQRRILQMLQEQTFVKLECLKGEFVVTPMTLWRDLKELEEQGLIRRVRGGAMHADVDVEPRFDTKCHAAKTAKMLIAKVAKERFVQKDGVYALEGGTTVAELAKCLSGYPATLLTNSISVLNELRCQDHNPSVYCSGGLLREESGTLVGKEAVTFFSRRKVDTFFMSASAFDLDSGLTDPNPMEIEVKQAMAFSAHQIVLLLDSSKLGTRSLMEIIPLRKVDTLITDKPLPDAYKALLLQHGVATIIATV